MLGLAAGVTNVGFVWGAIHGEVMRVLLLFYLTPAWTALFAHFILHERLNWSGGALAALSLLGAALMLWSPKLGVPLPANAAEWAGLIGGMGFAMSNVLVVKTSRVLPHMKPEMRTAVIFAGAALFGALTSCFEPMSAAPAGEHLARVVLLVLALGVVLGSNNMLVQYGLARVPANRASIIMLFEIVVTALTSWLFAGETPGPREWAGGACIVLASLLSSWVHRGQDARKREAHVSADASVMTHADATRTDESDDADSDGPQDNGGDCGGNGGNGNGSGGNAGGASGPRPSRARNGARAMV
jgi:drug/metabolite transporter (DMT)-like permease